MKYSEQLEDPRWKNKRIKILKRDKCRCTICNSEENLNIHHKYYVKGHKAWDYPNSALITLCNSCHNTWHENHILEIRETIWKKNREYIIPIKSKKKKKKKVSYGGYNTRWSGNTPYSEKYLTPKDIRKIKLAKSKEKLQRKLAKLNKIT